MTHPKLPSGPQSSGNPQEQRLDAFWRKALAAAPEAPIDATKLAAARTAIFAAAQQHSTAHAHRASSPWLAFKAWCSSGAQGFAPPRWATGMASITLASLVLVLWYGRMPEPEWDFDSANLMRATAPAPANAPAPMAEPVPAASAEDRPHASARQAAEARLQRTPNAPMAEAAPASKAAPERYQPQPAPPMPALAEDAMRAQDPLSSSVTLYGGADLASSHTAVQNQALLAQVQAADGLSWRANAQSLFAPLNAEQTKALLEQLLPLAGQAQAAAPADPSSPPDPLSLLQRNSLQLLLKQAGQVRVIVHIMASPHYQIDWLSPNNAWLASSPMGEAAYNRITATITSHAPSAP